MFNRVDKDKCFDKVDNGPMLLRFVLPASGFTVASYKLQCDTKRKTQRAINNISLKTSP